MSNGSMPSYGSTAEITGPNNQSLTSEQFKDIQYYRNGTINQVLAARDAAAQAAAEEAARKAQLAAEEAARLAAEKAALDEHVANANQQTNTLRKNEEALNPLVADNTFKQTVPTSLAQNITVIDPTYSASIKTIVIDGKTYVIEDDEEDKK
jgi:nucleoid-associated protein YgaU